MTTAGCYAIIPARGGSKGIPRKNLRLIQGVPLLGHSIRAALGAHQIARVFVSTEDREIGAVASSFGAEVIPRPPDLATDDATSEAVLLHALEFLEYREESLPELLAFVQCTSPFTSPGDIDGTVETLRRDNADSCFTVVPFHGFVWRTADAGTPTGANHDSTVRQRRQDRPKEYLETGAVYVFRVAGFQASRHRFFGRIAMHVTEACKSIEIDDPSDLELARIMLVHRSRSGGTLRNVDALVMDFDGVLTDNRVLVTEKGEEGVFCDRGDGYGLERIRRLGVRLLVLSKEKNAVVQRRCEKLGISCLQGVDRKGARLKSWLDEQGIEAARTIYVGNDLNDLECFELAGRSAAVADAHECVKGAADIVLTRPGGRGAVRELADMIAAGFGVDANQPL